LSLHGGFAAPSLLAGPKVAAEIRTCFNSSVTTEPTPTEATPRGRRAPAPTALARNQAARRRRVLDAALALAASGGFDGVQMRDVAAEAGVALGTVYRYFASKERLLLEAMVEQVEELGAGQRARPPAGATAADRVAGVLRRATGSLLRHPEATAAMVRALGSAQPDDAEVVRRVTAAMTAIITGAIHPGPPTARDLAVARALQQVWFSALLGWVGGVDPESRVAADLESAARLLLPAELDHSR
jgi:TetR/AcrR family transcriptional regulator, cholesterol catabolism regulator